MAVDVAEVPETGCVLESPLDVLASEIELDALAEDVVRQRVQHMLAADQLDSLDVVLGSDRLLAD